MCALRVPLSEHVYPQPSTSHAYGRSPVCLRMCALRRKLFAVVYPQPGALHAYERIAQFSKRRGGSE